MPDSNASRPTLYKATDASHSGGYRASASNKEYVARPNSPLAQDKPLFSEVNVTDRPSATRKRACLDALNVTPELEEPELENPRSKKRRGPVRRLAESLVRNPVPTPKSTPQSTPLPTPSGGVSHSRASTKRCLRSLKSDGEHDGAGTPRSSPSNFHTKDDGGHSAHSRRASQGVLHSSRGSISPLKRIAGEQYIGPDSKRREENKEDGGGGFGKNHNEVDRDNKLFPRSSAKPSPRRKPGNRPLEKKRHGPSRTTLGRQSPMPTRASRQGTSSQPQPLYRPPMGNRPLSCSPRALSPGTKAGDEPNINHTPSVDMSYHITDFTLSAVPNGSSVVTAVVRYRDSQWPLDLAALGPKFLGGDGKVIRMTQLSPESWMLLGYRYDDDASGPCTGRSLKEGWRSASYSDAANYETNSLGDDWDEKSEKGEEGMETYGQRTRIPWLESDELRLLSLKDEQKMEWKEICKRFPDRSPGAVKVRYYMLHKKDQ
ncbi:hypothetical protein K458DRAFT_425371 [Lentithecium fluviatile CBS 122367]|uniref:Myb-like domain-containing protein n=1 Tax=Lentithecium fluviatile CBS 122367 TaxID=1168545 RepID=A0A6G1JLR9_9PLEO|nr:hypothetical protein K458DRAFT_425371 [Lentithecium fluviatile CBS 122367]